MICRHCADAAATVHLTETRNDGTRLELHLCDGCSRSFGLTGDLPSTVTDLLAALGASPDPGGEGSYLVTPMDCERCGRNHATIHLFEACRGGGRERHLCERCGRFAAAILDAPFDTFPEAATEPRPVCPECGEIRFDLIRIGGDIRRNIRSATLPIRILLRGCAWSPP